MKAVLSLALLLALAPCAWAYDRDELTSSVINQPVFSSRRLDDGFPRITEVTATDSTLVVSFSHGADYHFVNAGSSPARFAAFCERIARAKGKRIDFTVDGRIGLQRDGVSAFPIPETIVTLGALPAFADRPPLKEVDARAHSVLLQLAADLKALSQKHPQLAWIKDANLLSTLPPDRVHQQLKFQRGLSWDNPTYPPRTQLIAPDSVDFCVVISDWRLRRETTESLALSDGATRLEMAYLLKMTQLTPEIAADVQAIFTQAADRMLGDDFEISTAVEGQ